MAEVSVEINGRKYRMACEDGQENHLRSLATRFNAQMEGFKGNFGEIGDNRLTVMAGIALLDELVEAEQKIASLRAELDEVVQAGQNLAEESDLLEGHYTRKMDDVAQRLERVASLIDGTGQGADGDV